MSRDEPLVPIKSSTHLLVEPIWETLIDDIEGPLYQAYIKKNPSYTQVLVRSGVRTRLEMAAKTLPTWYRLIVRAGHRPLEVQYNLLEKVKASYKTKKPLASEEDTLTFARTYVSDPRVKVPPHCAGSAIDVDVLDVKTGQLVDFGCPVNTDDEIASLHTDKISLKQRANRKMLQKVMLSAGFASFEPEWWHFSYGDQTWADFYKKPAPLYGLIEA